MENVPEAASSAKSPEGKGRTISAIAAHIHNVRLLWLKAAGSTEIPDKLDDTASLKNTLRALQASHKALATLLTQALRVGHVKGFKPDAGAFYSYLIAHDAHHRGQIASLARRLGHPVPQNVGFGMWDWNARRKEIA